MLRHIVLLTWTPDATEEQKQAARTAFHALPEHVSQIRALSCGADLGLGAGGHDFAAVMDFDGVEDWRAYQDHPAHRALIAEYLAPILAGRAAIQFDV